MLGESAESEVSIHYKSWPIMKLFVAAACIFTTNTILRKVGSPTPQTEDEKLADYAVNIAITL